MEKRTLNLRIMLCATGIKLNCASSNSRVNQKNDPAAAGSFFAGLLFLDVLPEPDSDENEVGEYHEPRDNSQKPRSSHTVSHHRKMWTTDNYLAFNRIMVQCMR